MLQTIEKASDVLALFDRDHTEWGVREVAEALGLAKSSAHDLLTSLKSASWARASTPIAAR
jgi:DNA-binding IclR family transcriptional regulator